MKTSILILLLSTTIGTTFGQNLVKPKLFPYTENVMVKSVHDGDSYKVSKLSQGLPTKQTYWVRIAGANAPEVISNHITDNQPFGLESGDFARKMLDGKIVKITAFSKDRYHRTIADVFYVDSVGTLRRLDSCLIANGLAMYRSNKTFKKGAILQKQVKKSKKGLWSQDKPITDANWRKTHWVD